MAPRASLRCFVPLLLLTACRYPATTVLINADSNVAASRVDLLELRVVRGAATVAAVRSAPRTVLDPPAGTPLFANSFAIVPPEGGDRSGTLTFLATLRVRAEGDSPAAFIERVHRVSMLERVRQQGRVFFDLRCADRAEGCTSVGAEQCTVSVRCLELESTCGDQGECVPIELPLSTSDAAPTADASNPIDVMITRADVVRRDSAADTSASMDAMSDGSATDAMDAADVRTDSAATDAMDAADVRTDSGVMDVTDAGDVRTDTGADAASLVPARPIEPQSGALVGGSRVRFRWTPTGANYRVDLCRDRSMSTGCMTALTSTSDTVTVPSSLAAGVWYWRITSTSIGGAMMIALSPVWQFRVGRGASAAVPSTSHQIELDINGDGYSDLAVGQPSSSPPRVLIYAGSPTGLALMPTWTVIGVAGESTGAALSTAGDINGDGYPDLLVGSPTAMFAASAGAGVARVYLGGPMGPSMTPFAVFGGRAAAEGFADAVSTAGDSNGDGYADMAISASQSNAARGLVRVFLGGPGTISTTPARSYNGGAAGDQFGQPVAMVGDVNGDSFSDLAIGARYADVGMTDTGQATLYLGSATGLPATAAQAYSGTVANTFFGWSIAGADIDGNGLTDLLLSTRWEMVSGMNNVGAVRLYRGNNPPPVNSSRTYTGTAAGDEFGFAVRGADTNGDGLPDVIASAPGAAFMALGRVGTVTTFHMLTSPERVVGGGAVGTDFGTSITASGDFNNDGYFDVAVGARVADPSGLMDAGRVTVYYGSASGIALTPSVTLNGSVSNGQFGAAVTAGH